MFAFVSWLCVLNLFRSCSLCIDGVRDSAQSKNVLCPLLFSWIFLLVSTMQVAAVTLRATLGLNSPQRYGRQVQKSLPEQVLASIMDLTA